MTEKELEKLCLHSAGESFKSLLFVKGNSVTFDLMERNNHKRATGPSLFLLRIVTLPEQSTQNRTLLFSAGQIFIVVFLS